MLSTIFKYSRHNQSVSSTLLRNSCATCAHGGIMALASTSIARESVVQSMVPTTTTSESELSGTELIDETSSSSAVSLLDCLRAPRQSELKCLIFFEHNTGIIGNKLNTYCIISRYRSTTFYKSSVTACVQSYIYIYVDFTECSHADTLHFHGLGLS